MSIKSVRLRIEGRVQGIWYRGWTVDQARALNIDGWVRNKADGSVVAVLSGAQDNVDAMIKVCHDGPPWPVWILFLWLMKPILLPQVLNKYEL